MTRHSDIETLLVNNAAWQQATENTDKTFLKKARKANLQNFCGSDALIAESLLKLFVASSPEKC